MRVLLINPELPYAYWSLPELCRIQGCKAQTIPLGLVTVAALLPPDWQLRLVDQNTRPLTGADWEWADLVLISGLERQQAPLLNLVQEAKARGKTVVAGGPYPSTLPDEVMAAGCDFVVRGEAELIMPRLLEAMAQGSRGTVFECSEKPDLALSPIPRYDLIRPQDYLSLSVQTTRGCPFDCEFCDVFHLYGRKVRKKRVAQVLAELESIYRLGGAANLFIADDNFVGDKAYARELLTQLIPWMKARGEPFDFIAQTSVNLGRDKELIDLMTEANFSTVFIGVESPEAHVLRLAHKHQNLEVSLVESLKAINANGLSIIASFILGLDGEAPGAGDRIGDFVEAADLPVATLNLLNPLMNTRLWHRLQGEGRLREDRKKAWLKRNAPEEMKLSRLFYRPDRPEEQILAEFQRTMERLYEPAAFLSRAYRAVLAMRPTRAALAAGEGKPAPSVPQSPHSLNFSVIWSDLQRFLRLACPQGLRSPHRRQFWRQLLGVWRQNPSRLSRYLRICAHGQDLFSFRERQRRLREEGRSSGPAR